MRAWRYLVVGLVMIGAWGLAMAMRPTPSVDVRSVSLERQIPSAFGKWHEMRSALVQMDLAPRNDEGVQQEAGINWPYDQTLTRAYSRADGETVMFALAWGSKQRQEIKVHRPELCYAAQGFQILQQKRVPVRVTDDIVVPTTHLVTRGQSRMELVTYWIRVGDKISMNAWQSRLEIFGQGLRGTIPDGILVRISQSRPLQDADLEKSYAIQESFVKDLLAHLDQSTVKLLAGPKSTQ